MPWASAFTPCGPLEAGIDGLPEVRDPITSAGSGRLVAVQVRTKVRHCSRRVSARPDHNGFIE
jgi:hypothetical protein